MKECLATLEIESLPKQRPREIRRSFCTVCGKEIFKCQQEPGGRAWWHEKASLDFHHKAKPRRE